MASTIRGVWRALFPLWLFLACALAQIACTCAPTGQVRSTKALACRPQHERVAISPPLTTRTIVPGTIPISFAITDSGEAALSMPLVVPPGRAGVAPSLAISYSSSGGDGVLGVGFSVSGASAINRCPKTMAIDGEIRAVQYDADDAFCLDGKRLVVVAQNDKIVEYRTWPDTQVKIIAHFAENGPEYFDAFLPSGNVVEYGKTAGSRPTALKNVPRAWLASEMRDARGNAMTYGYCFAEADGFTAEYALDEIRYGSSVVSFMYGTKDADDVRTVYSAGMAFQSALRLDEVQTRVGDDLVRRYEFAYESSETTGRTRLVSAQECGADGACKPATRFQYAKSVTTGFEHVATKIPAPTSRLASYMLADFNGDGLDDLLSPDTTALSTQYNPITQWNIARNQGNGFAAPIKAFWQFWPPLLDPSDFADPTQIQPELGTTIDFDQDGRMDVLLHDVYGRKNNHIVLRSKADGTFEEANTQVKRPFPLGSVPKQLRNAGGAVHIADVNGDGVGDLIQCEDHGESPNGNPSQPVWMVRLWTSGGFVTNSSPIEPLAGFSCAVELRTVDVNRNGKIDFVVPGMINIGGTPATQTTTYHALEWQPDWTWKTWDTNLPIPSSSGRVIFADVNGDGLPDAVATGASDGRLRTWMNTGIGFATTPADSLKWDGLFPQEAYVHLATPLDYDGDGRTDLLMPMSTPPELPRWFILRATGGSNGFTFERMNAGIPFEAQLGEAVTLADPRGPRVGDVNGDGAADLVLFIGDELQIFQNRATNPDALVSYSDGLNEHDPGDSSFIPNVSLLYGHLTDEWITNGAQSNDSKKESYLYLSRNDASNECEYPRRCAVGPKRVVREYATNDGQGGVRRFGLRYRDGRYDRRGHGFLGFDERILTDLDTGAETATFYDNETLVKVGERDVYPFAGQVHRQWRWAPALPNESKKNRVELAFADIAIDVVPTNGGQTFFTMPTKRHTRRMQGVHASGDSIEPWVAGVAANENATMLRDTTVVVLDFDAYGNVLEVDVSTVGVDLTMHVTRTMKNDVSRWILGQPDTQTECSKAAGSSLCRSVTTTTNEFGEVESTSTSSNENIPDTKLTVEYDKRDKYGNIEHVTAKDAFGYVRESTTIYESDGVFPVKEINALGHETTLEYDPAFGNLKKTIDPNGLVTEWKYDSFGRETLEKRPDGSQTTTTLSRNKVGDTWQLSERTTTTGGGDDETVFDNQGRPMRLFSHGPEPASQKGKTPRRMQSLAYDRLSGQVSKRSITAAEGTPDDELIFDTYEYDALGREIRHTTPWNATITTKYDGLLVDSTDSLLQHTITELDTLGRPITITDPAKGKTKYSYGSFGWLRTVTDPGNDVTTWMRDAFGRVRQLDEPDRGTTHYEHNGFDELRSSTDALGRIATFDMDALGRTKTRTDTLGAQVLTTTWTWDKAPNGIGRLFTLMSPDGIKTYFYSKRGQLERVSLTVEGESFVARQVYDEMGRVKSVDYPQPLGAEPFGVTHEYDDHGFVIGVREKNTNEVSWTLKEVDDAGRIQKERFGNDVETTRAYDHDKQALKSISTTLGATNIQALAYDWDARLNLKSRTDARQQTKKTERFRYDELDRVTCAYFAAVENVFAPCETSYSYQANGNLWEKSDVGMYSYTDPKHPHAVTHVSGETFVYDEVGNQIKRPGGVSMTYTPFDLPKTITKSGKTTSFGYDGDQQRIRKTTPIAETLYFGDIFEQVTSAAGVVEHRFFVHSLERAIAVVTHGGAEPGIRYMHVDHLGSVDVITKEDGSVDERRSYDAFGARRNPQWGGPSEAFTSRTTRGFTGHEEDDEFGLVNMKGRIFDPHIGRFTTTDSVIADLHFGQSFNAYAYVWNNPLSLIDPSGFEPSPPPEQRNWYVEDLPDRNGLGIRITYEPPSQPTPPPNPAAQQPVQSASVGASAAPVDVSTTGSGGGGLPQETTEPESTGASPIVQFFEGVGERTVELVPELALGIIFSNASAPISTLFRAQPGSATLDGAGERAIDAVNSINPLYAAGIDAVDGANAYDRGDFVGVGRATIGLGVTVLMTVITLKGAGRGAESPKSGSARGPGSGKRVTPQQRQVALGENNGTCVFCGRPATEADHAIPKSRGGDTTTGPAGNLQPTCQHCNRQKGPKTSEEYLKWLQGRRKGNDGL